MKEPYIVTAECRRKGENETFLTRTFQVFAAPDATLSDIRARMGHVFSEWQLTRILSYERVSQ